jgi:flagellar assembly protein FliH
MAELAGSIEQNRRAAADMAAAAEVLSSALHQLRRADTTQVDGVEQNVLTLAVALAEEIIGRQIRDDDQLVMTAAARALALAPDREPVLLRVNPADVAVVRESMPADEATVHPLQVVADASIERGGVVAEVGPLRIDAQVGPALARIRDAFAQ